MQEYFTNLLDQSAFPLWSAFLLGLITSLGPCTLSTNISAVAFIGKEAQCRRRVFLGGLVYTLGRAVTYFVVALPFYFGAELLNLTTFLTRYGEMLIGPLLILVGVVMLDWIPIPFPTFSKLRSQLEADPQKGLSSHFLLGVVFALAFCSYSGVMYFGLLIPMTIQSSGGLLLPIAFALGTGVSVVGFAALIAFAFQAVNRWFLRIRQSEIWLRRLVAVVFIAIGIYQVGRLF
ncbi:aromatic aminobenezylarsenical efflux permease ArsG family transporter [Gaoshiqia sediminis]|uniref:Aromatic aminobenezylarsenical efflux permease ArsG family transporter n=1 Tax=Gaoshiqia sediminis TaxID=2986998 RepID=A0AA42C6E1_9BACT|nr:aromatic aminobenezylarsenical efflux permease ArsG family transporter [Gaoshiqia sediminis]MCW0483813.1 aromatic aminobenezylarsenical efflux permease ArsG family transporter [Gaoshiqia sediminis]